MAKKNRLANELLQNELFTDLVAEMQQDYFNNWVDSDTPEAREQIYLRMQACEDIISQLQAIALETSK